MLARSEIQPGRAGETQINRGFRSRPKRISDDEKRQIFEEAKTDGRIDNLTPKQVEVFRLRGYFEGGEGDPLTPFRQVILQNPTLKTFQAAHDREKHGFKMLEDGPRTKTSKMKPDEREFIVSNPDLPAASIAVELKHTENTIAKYKDEVGVPRRPIGRPRKRSNDSPRPKRKEASPDLMVDLYSNKGLSTTEVAIVVERSVPTVIKQLRAHGVTIRPRGPYRSRQKQTFPLID